MKAEQASVQDSTPILFASGLMEGMENRGGDLGLPQSSLINCIAWGEQGGAKKGTGPCASAN